jgi:hypothetical protein
MHTDEQEIKKIESESHLLIHNRRHAPGPSAMKLICRMRSHHLLTETLAPFCIVGKPLSRFFICHGTW